MSRLRIPPLIRHLPTRVTEGLVVCVHGVNCIEVRLHVGFGISVTKRIIIEGIDWHRIPPKLRALAPKALVVLLGGKPVLVHTGPEARDGRIYGRVYLNVRTHDAPAEVLHVPHGCEQPLLEVGFFFQWLQARDFDIPALLGVLNGRRAPAAAETSVASEEEPLADESVDA